VRPELLSRIETHNHRNRPPEKVDERIESLDLKNKVQESYLYLRDYLWMEKFSGETGEILAKERRKITPETKINTMNSEISWPM
jgi:hypothetical protein